jgi:light-regulated signal transduction histidine kinase (bacteriophytochrome)
LLIISIFDKLMLNFRMKKKNENLKYYTINISGCILLVLAFASIQYQAIQKLEFDISNYIIPFIVGGIFGYQITRIRILQERYKAEKDQGLGMSKEDLAHLFEESHKLSSRPTAGEASSGLGLSVAKKLAQQIGGEIIAESEGKNQGSTFRVRLKLAIGK